jgi:hypothetical protein
LLLLALLLPLRGAVAAAMLCPVGSPASQPNVHAAQQLGHPGDEHRHAQGSGHVHADSGPQDAHDHGGADKCHLCSAFCSLTPLMSSAPRLPEPAVLAGVSFPDLSAPAPSFVSDGQERPPRTC